MSKVSLWTYSIVYCCLAMIVGGVVGAAAGVGVAGIAMKPEEAVILYAGVGYGGPLGMLVGLGLGCFAMSRKHPAGRPTTDRLA